MLENLLGTLKSEVGSQILSQTQLPSSQLDKVFSLIGDVSKKEISSQMLGGGLGNVIDDDPSPLNEIFGGAGKGGLIGGAAKGLLGKLFKK
ncbi:MAG: hypothetical protein LLG13_07245 [Bacteroidales bacterium]|nr:hypothetical protein [Bacteroidales bacterium]